MLKQEQNLLGNLPMTLKFIAGSVMRNGLFAQCQSFSPQVNLQWRNLADIINQAIQVHTTSTETEWHHGPPDISHWEGHSVTVILAKWENIRHLKEAIYMMIVLDSSKVKVVRGMVRKGRIKAMWDPGTEENSGDNPGEIRTGLYPVWVSWFWVSWHCSQAGPLPWRAGELGEEHTRTHILNYIRNVSVSLKLTQKRKVKKNCHRGKTKTEEASQIGGDQAGRTAACSSSRAGVRWWRCHVKLIKPSPLKGAVECVLIIKQ